MNVIYHQKAKRSGEDYTMLQQASKRLEEILRSSDEPVSAEWDRTQNAKGEPVFVLRLSDSSGAATAVFAPEDLRSPYWLSQRLRLLWDELLGIRSSKLLQSLTGGSQEDH